MILLGIDSDELHATVRSRSRDPVKGILSVSPTSDRYKHLIFTAVVLVRFES